MIKFRTFSPSIEYQDHGMFDSRRIELSATYKLNEWLEENPDVEIISWNTTAVGKEHELWITIQYTEREHTTSVCSGGCSAKED